MISKKEKKQKKFQELAYESDDFLIYDISQYFCNLSLREFKRISFDSEFFQNNIYKSNKYSDELIRSNDNYHKANRIVCILYLFFR